MAIAARLRGAIIPGGKKGGRVARINHNAGNGRKARKSSRG